MSNATLNERSTAYRRIGQQVCDRFPDDGRLVIVKDLNLAMQTCSVQVVSRDRRLLHAFNVHFDGESNIVSSDPSLPNALPCLT